VNITSYNITDVSYHYVGLRVVESSGGASRDRLAEMISAAVLKLVMDRALRMMLPAPRGTFSSAGEKVLNELKHFGLTETEGKHVGLTEAGKAAHQLLQSKQFVQLRRVFIRLHLETYSNFREVLLYLAGGESLLRPIKDSIDPTDLAVAWKVFLPWDSEGPARSSIDLTPQKVEDAITARLLERAFSGTKVTVPIFRSMCDRMTSLRLVNQSRVTKGGMEAFAIYSTCRKTKTRWQHELSFVVSGSPRTLFLSEYSIELKGAREALLAALKAAFDELEPEGGFYDLPDVRDKVCMSMLIPEAAFDEALLQLLESGNAPFSFGLRYERISGRRRPLVRQPGNQILNLIRPTS